MTTPAPKTTGSGKPDILTDIVAQVLSAGATEFEVEYKDGEEQICAMSGAVGFSVASLPSASDDARQLRSELYGSRKKRARINVFGVDYRLCVEVFDSFGEDAFRVIIMPDKH